MKFFSNDPKDPDHDDSHHDDRDHGSDVVTSEPVAVPQQRAGSPWSDSPAAAEPEFSDRGTTTTYGPDGTVTEPTRDEQFATADSSKHDTGKDATASDHSASDHTAVDGTVKDDGTFDSPAAVDPATGEEIDKSDSSDLDRGQRADDAAASADGEAAGDDTHRDAGWDTHGDTAEGTAAENTGEGEALKDDGTFDSPTAVDPATGDELDKSDKFDVDAPAAVDPTTGESLDKTASDGTGPVVAAVPVAAATPGSVPAPSTDRLFAEGDSFADRFREIQLTFVDSPKEATAQAAALVSEAIEAVTAALDEKKNAFAAGSEDTEQLRVELRGYRDLLKRISEL